MMMCGVLLAGSASAVTIDQWTTFDLPYQKVSVLGVVDAWLNLEQSRVVVCPRIVETDGDT
jgi:hypothetical protein